MLVYSFSNVRDTPRKIMLLNHNTVRPWENENHPWALFTIWSFFTLTRALNFTPKGKRMKPDKVMTPRPHRLTFFETQTYKCLHCIIARLELWPLFPFNTTLHLMRWEIAEGLFSSLSIGVSFHWFLHAQPVDHGKAINAVDDFVTMYKQRTQIRSMSNHTFTHLFRSRWMYTNYSGGTWRIVKT